MRQRSWETLTQGGENILPQAAETSRVKVPRFKRFWRSRSISASIVMRPNRSMRQHTSKGVMPLSRSTSATRWAASSSNCWYRENSPAISSRMPAVVLKCSSTTSRIWAARSSAASFIR